MGDALQIVNTVNSKSLCDSSYGHFVEDVKAGLFSMGNSKFVHVNREANLAAHVLPKEACKHAIDSIWWHCTLFCIDGIIEKEEVSPSL